MLDYQVSTSSAATLVFGAVVQFDAKRKQGGGTSRCWRLIGRLETVLFFDSPNTQKVAAVLFTQ